MDSAVGATLLHIRRRHPVIDTRTGSSRIGLEGTLLSFVYRFEQVGRIVPGLDALCMDSVAHWEV